MTDWWRAVDDELERRGDTAPDPWGDAPSRHAQVALTAEQRAFMEQLAETIVPDPSDDTDDDLADADLDDDDDDLGSP